MARSTRQRKAIQEILDSADGPLLPEDILAKAQPLCPSIGAATVYRTLRALKERGAIKEVVTPDQRVRYENVGPHHHHFQCRECDQVFDVAGCRRAALRTDLLLEPREGEERQTHEARREALVKHSEPVGKLREVQVAGLGLVAVDDVLEAVLAEHRPQPRDAVAAIVGGKDIRFVRRRLRDAAYDLRVEAVRNQPGNQRDVAPRVRRPEA